jgi:hypothetical protein
MHTRALYLGTTVHSLSGHVNWKPLSESEGDVLQVNDVLNYIGLLEFRGHASKLRSSCVGFLKSRFRGYMSEYRGC